MTNIVNDFVFINQKTLRDIMANAAEMGATQALVQVGKLSQYITKQEAYKRFGGRRKVDGWIVSGVLNVHAAGIDLIEISTLASSINVATYINSASYQRTKEVTQ